jgi:ribosomal protein S18 acetylase RimI-like enzyme
LMHVGVEAMRAAGYRDAILYVLDDNPRARRFYEREGWALDGGTKREELLGVEIAEVRYRRGL